MIPTPTPTATSPVCPECGTPVAFRRLTLSCRVRVACRLYSPLVLLTLLTALAAAAWTTRYDSRPHFSSTQGQITPGQSLPIGVAELRALAGRTGTGDAITRVLVEDARTDWAASAFGMLTVYRDDKSAHVGTGWAIGWPLKWLSGTASFRVPDRERPDGPRLPLPPTWTPDGPHANAAWIWGTWANNRRDTQLFAGGSWWLWVQAALVVVLVGEALRLASLVRHRRAWLAARADPRLPDPLNPPGPRRRRAFRIIAVVVAISMFVPTWRTRLAPTRIALNAVPGTTPAIAVADLELLVGDPNADGRLAARLVAIIDAADASVAVAGDPTASGDEIWCQWVWSRRIKRVGFGFPGELLWAYPDFGIHWYQITAVDQAAHPDQPFPRLPLQCRWTGFDWAFEVMFPTTAGDSERAGLIVDPRSVLTTMALLYVAWRLLATPWPTYLAWRSRRRWLAGRCVACAYPVDRPDSPAATA